jgi:uncharacterized DUF497 family protein
MKISFDPAKNARNIAERDLPFELAIGFDFDSAAIWQDVRRTYPEPRFIALGYLGGRLHVLCFTPAVGGIWVISFRKANAKEARRHGKPQIRDDKTAP